jgi:hypothetical protein
MVFCETQRERLDSAVSEQRYQPAKEKAACIKANPTVAGGGKIPGPFFIAPSS